PTECLTPLIGMMPCMNYLTNLTVLAPPVECCDGLKSIIRNAPICLCHGMTGDMNDLMPVPIDPVRMIILPLACGAMLPLQTLFSCNIEAARARSGAAAVASGWVAVAEAGAARAARAKAAWLGLGWGGVGTL
uniref:Bifunctional inhibitor/plant lipid transfer protein/seed storage helical domain-containing protein n=1 Tax=Setaria italica TaxID=4555 RepID=A0A0Q3QYB5_SETIT